MAVRREYKGGAVTTTISAGISASATTISLTDATGWPTGTTGPFYAVIDKGLSTEESILVTSRSTTTLNTVSRGQNDTVGVAHGANAPIQHVGTKTDFDEANAHITSTSADDHTQYLLPARHDLAARHTVGSVIPAGATAADLGVASVPGAANTVSRGDHTHAYGAWTAFTPVWKGDTTDPAIGNGTLAGRYLLVGKMLWLRFFMQVGSTTTLGSGNWYFLLPASLSIYGATANADLSATAFLANVGGSVLGSGLVFITAPTKIYPQLPTATNTRVFGANATTPAAWVTGDFLRISGACEVA